MTLSTEHIAKTPGVCGGKPCIEGTRIRVHDIVIQHRDQGRTVEQIIESYPHLTPGDVYAAMAYYHDHREEIDAIMRHEREVYEEGKRNQPLLEEIIRRKREAQSRANPSR